MPEIAAKYCICNCKWCTLNVYSEGQRLILCCKLNNDLYYTNSDAVYVYAVSTYLALPSVQGSLMILTTASSPTKRASRGLTTLT